jgi:hypothetical protein
MSISLKEKQLDKYIYESLQWRLVIYTVIKQYRSDHHKQYRFMIVSRTSKNDRQYNGQKEKAQKIMHKTVHGKEQ